MQSKFIRSAAALTCVLTVCSVGAGSPPINDIWQDTYAKGSQIREFRIQAYEANCRVCHRINARGLMEGPTNYGEAVGKFLKRSILNDLNTDHDKRKAYIEDGLKRAGQEAASNGKSFQEMFDAGERPWVLPE